MINSLLYKKTCRTIQQADKERAILQTLQMSSLRSICPKPTEIYQEPLVVEMSFIQGISLTPKNLNLYFISQLGKALQQLHSLRSYTTFGLFDAELQVLNCFTKFEDFVNSKIQKWILWHKVAPGSYLEAYAIWLNNEFSKLRSYFNDVKPIFCHGDIDTKNLILKKNQLSGIIDWEHAGAFCLAWELRKLPRILQNNYQWQKLLSIYNNSIKINQSTLMQAIRYLDAVDLLGHLRWCIIKNLHSQKELTLKRMYSYFKPKEVSQYALTIF